MDRHIALLVCIVLGLSAPALAFRPHLGPGRHVRVEGIVEPTADGDRLGTLTLRAADELRSFAVLSAVSAGEKGWSIFRNRTLFPESFRLVGERSVIEALRDAPPGTRLRIVGMIRNSDLLVGEIEEIGG
jgi:hypothetical protein